MNTPAAQALARALLHSLWEGALIALLLAAILQMCRYSSARLRYAFACAALFAIPLAFGMTFWLSLPAERAYGATAAPSFSSVLLMLRPTGNSPASVRGPEPPAMPWLVPLWMTGVACFYVYGLAGWIAAQRLRRVGVCAASAVWQERLDALAVRLRVGRPVALLESCLANTPVMIGVLRPVILAPLGILTGLPTSQVESILLHELAHIRRHDYLVSLIQRLVEGLLFYHPAVWWISSLVRTEREFCCDDLVVELSGDPRGYAEALSTLEQRRWTQTALAANGGNLMTRIRRVLQQQEGPRIAAGPVAGLLLLLSCAALVAWQPIPKPAPSPVLQVKTPVPDAAPMPPAQAQPERQRLIAQAKSRPQSPSTPAPPAATAPSDAYQKWLNEDVFYIITYYERVAFGQLQTDDKRQQFIEQFWLRRDPTPGTAENEYKDEHYRRMQYSNDRFGGAQPGWKTDRGAVYILFGPPDQLDDHSIGPSGGPYQTWHYPYIEGIGKDVKFEFVGSGPTGDYHLVADRDGNAPSQQANPIVIPQLYNGSQRTFFFLEFEEFRKQTPPKAVFELNPGTAAPALNPAR